MSEAILEINENVTIRIVQAINSETFKTYGSTPKYLRLVC